MAEMVNFNLANPYQAQLDALARRQQMADIMAQQSLQPMQAPGTYNGIQAPISHLSGLAKILEGYTAGKEERAIKEERQKLGERAQTEAQDWIKNIVSQPGVAPVSAYEYKPTAADYEDNPNLQVADGMVQAPIQAGLPARTRTNAEQMAYLMKGAQNPISSGLANTLLSKNIEQQEFQNILDKARNPSAAPSVVSSAVPSPVGGQVPTATQGIIPQSTANGLNLPALAMSGNSRAMDLAKFLQGSQTEKMKDLRAAGIVEGSPQWNAALTDVATQGGIWQRDANGKLSLAPGYAVGQGSIKGAETAAAAENEISTKTIGGREVIGTNRQFRILAIGEAPTNAEAQSVMKWANRNGIRVSIQGPSPQAEEMPQSSNVTGPSGAGIRNPTQTESAQEKELATGGAAAITKKLDSSYDLAKNSVERITTINDLKSVIDLPAFSGPGATTQLLLGQLANKFYGVSNAETLANTTLKLQGLADLSLKAAGLIRGQGSITEPERALLAKAKSATENLTVPEYKALFKVLEKQDTGIIKEHQDLVKRAQKAKVPNIDFWSVDIPIPQVLNLSPNARKLLSGKK